MKNDLQNYLKESIHENVVIQVWSDKKKLPIFLTELYDFYESEILGQRCLLIEILREAPGVDELKKHIKVINKVVDYNIIFVYKSISGFRRKSLIDNRISFVVESGQMYLPFLGLDLKKATEKPVEDIITFSGSTQLAFLYFLYNENLTINATELSKVFSVTKMTASRILNELYNVGLLTYEIGGKTGRSKDYKRKGDPEYYREGSRYLKDPVNQIIYVDKVMGNYSIAGLEALSMISMVNPPDRPIRAISNKKLNEVKNNIIKDRDRIVDEKVVELQIWHYDPKLLSEDNRVDLVSLLLSLSEINDERVEQAIEERLEGERWMKLIGI